MSSTSTTTGAERIAAAFERHGKRAALMPYVMGGFPTLEDSRAIGLACVEAGADLIELGMPYSDPLADGPIIHAAGTRALAQGTTLAEVLDVGRTLAAHVPVVLMTYTNLVVARGFERFTAQLRDAGISGVILPDLPLEESERFREAFDAAGLALVPLVAPTTPDERMREISSAARGFLYAVAVTGTTGERAQLAPGVADVLRRARASSEVPVALGFGISTPAQAREAAELGAQGIIVASRLVREAGEADDPAAAVGTLVAALGEALRT